MQPPSCVCPLFYYYVSVKKLCRGSLQEPVWSAAPRSIGVPHVIRKKKKNEEKDHYKERLKRENRASSKRDTQYEGEFSATAPLLQERPRTNGAVVKSVLLGLVQVFILASPPALSEDGDWKEEAVERRRGQRRLSTHAGSLPCASWRPANRTSLVAAAAASLVLFVGVRNRPHFGTSSRLVLGLVAFVYFCAVPPVYYVVTRTIDSSDLRCTH